MRIGIIGAGISGLSAAHYLMKKGYTDICVMEASERVGGKCHTILYHGKTYEMGASMALPSHVRVKRLMKHYQVKPSGISMTRGHYRTDGKLATQLPKDQRRAFIEQLNRLPEVLAQYPWLKTTGFSDFPEALAQPFSKWCYLHELEVLSKIYEQCFTTFGLGDINCVPAGYVLKEVTYENLMGFLEISRILTCSKGTGGLLQRMADQVPELKLAQQVLKIELVNTEAPKSLEGPVRVTLNTGEAIFDRVIYTGDLTALNALMPERKMAFEDLAQVKAEDYYVYAFKLKGIPEFCGYVPENLTLERRGHILVWHHQWPMDKDREMVTVYAYGSENMSEAERVKTVVEDLEKLGCRDVQLFFRKEWRHFPHFETDMINAGIYNHLEKQQGVSGVYLTGEILAGTNMEGCVAYSEQLVERYF